MSHKYVYLFSEGNGKMRELLGGNGILIDEHVGRYVGDAEAIYSYEGTREMNTLIVGKASTGLRAFVGNAPGRRHSAASTAGT